MKRGLKWGLWLIALLAVSLGLYTLGGWIDARRDAPALKAEIAALDAQGRGVSMLTPQQRSILLKVEDPAFLTHNGADWSTPGAATLRSRRVSPKSSPLPSLSRACANFVKPLMR